MSTPDQELEQFGRGNERDLRRFREEVKPRLDELGAGARCAFCGEPATRLAKREGQVLHRAVCDNHEADGSPVSGDAARRRRLEAFEREIAQGR